MHVSSFLWLYLSSQHLQLGFCPFCAMEMTDVKVFNGFRNTNSPDNFYSTFDVVNSFFPRQFFLLDFLITMSQRELFLRYGLFPLSVYHRSNFVDRSSFYHTHNRDFQCPNRSVMDSLALPSVLLFTSIYLSLNAMSLWQNSNLTKPHHTSPLPYFSSSL